MRYIPTNGHVIHARCLGEDGAVVVDSGDGSLEGSFLGRRAGVEQASCEENCQTLLRLGTCFPNDHPSNKRC